MSHVTLTKSRLGKKETLEALAEVTSPRCTTIDSLQQQVKRKIRFYLESQKISYAALAKNLRDVGNSLDDKEFASGFRYARDLKQMLEGNSQLSPHFGNTITGVLQVGITTFLPIEFASDEDYLTAAKKVFKCKIDPKEARFMVDYTLWRYALGS